VPWYLPSQSLVLLYNSVCQEKEFVRRRGRAQGGGYIGLARTFPFYLCTHWDDEAGQGGSAEILLTSGELREQYTDTSSSQTAGAESYYSLDYGWESQDLTILVPISLNDSGFLISLRKYQIIDPNYVVILFIQNSVLNVCFLTIRCHMNYRCIIILVLFS